jgi:hypothetical protein
MSSAGRCGLSRRWTLTSSPSPASSNATAAGCRPTAIAWSGPSRTLRTSCRRRLRVRGARGRGSGARGGGRCVPGCTGSRRTRVWTTWRAVPPGCCWRTSRPLARKRIAPRDLVNIDGRMSHTILDQRVAQPGQRHRLSGARRPGQNDREHATRVSQPRRAMAAVPQRSPCGSPHTRCGRRASRPSNGFAAQVSAGRPLGHGGGRHAGPQPEHA